MNAELKSLLYEKYKTDDLLQVDFRSVEHAAQEEVNFFKVRGSVRLMMRRVLTPKDVSRMLDRVVQLVIPR